MFDEPMPKGSRLPESPRINSLLAGLMGSSPARGLPLPPAPMIPPAVEPSESPKSITGRPFGTFLRSIQWAFVPSTESRVVVTPGTPVREFFAMVNWPGGKDPVAASASRGGSIQPPSVENLMSQFAWD